MTAPVVTAFRWVPPFAQGLVRDLRVRWAMEEAGRPYDVKLIGFEDQGTDAYRALQPFGQVPAYTDGGLTLFESGAIVLHVAEGSDALLPADADARARAITWMFSALNTMEPAIQGLVEIDIFFPDEDWAKGRRPGAEARVVQRLKELSTRLADRPYLDGERFTAGDLMMSSVLRILHAGDLVEQTAPNLAAYRARCEARPAFQKALAGQMGDFVDAA